MSHVIDYWTYSADSLNKDIITDIYLELLDRVMEEYPDEEATENGWEGMAGCARDIIFTDCEFVDKERAYEHLQKLPAYTNMAVKYMEGKKQFFLIRTEYHC